MDPAPKIVGPDAKPDEPFSFYSGALKRHQVRHHRQPPPLLVDFLYRECLKNHAASLGGHALDGCGEFMPSPAANPADPTSLKCAACGCHRNFHRRLPEPLLLHHPDVGGGQEGEEEMDGSVDQDNDGRDEEEEDGEANGCRGCRGCRSSASPPRHSSAPHMFLALSSSLPAASPPGRPAVVLPKKRFRTKFSPEQKERMQELSERLGWRMQKRDDGLVEEWCRQIGVGKGVFKVWMHNNKNAFLGLARRGKAGGGNGSGGGDGCGGGDGGDSGGIEDSGNGGGRSNSHAVNGSSSSS